MNFKIIYQFLIDLQINNNRAWFNDNKQRYLEAKELFDTFVDQLIQGLKTVDESIVLTSLFKGLKRLMKALTLKMPKTVFLEYTEIPAFPKTKHLIKRILGHLLPVADVKVHLPVITYI